MQSSLSPPEWGLKGPERMVVTITVGGIMAMVDGWPSTHLGILFFRKIDLTSMLGLCRS